jgi:hypothetical protein
MSLKPLVNNKDIWDAFNKELDARLQQVHIQMEQATVAETLYRLQGQAFCLRKLKMLRDHVNGQG